MPGAAAGTLGLEPMTLAVIDYAKTGDLEGAEERLGTVVAGDLTAAGTIKLAPVVGRVGGRVLRGGGRAAREFFHRHPNWLPLRRGAAEPITVTPEETLGLRSATEGVSVPEGHTRVYRAVSEAEYQDIMRTGEFRSGPNSLEGKWFADTLEGACRHGDALEGTGNYRIIEADVPDNAPSLFRLRNLDGRGPGRYLDLKDLKNVVPRDPTGA